MMKNLIGLETVQDVLDVRVCNAQRIYMIHQIHKGVGLYTFIVIVEYLRGQHLLGDDCLNEETTSIT